MQILLPTAARIAKALLDRNATLAIAESSAGGLISAALLAVPGASGYFLGGSVIYTAHARSGLLGITPEDMDGMRASTEPYARLLAARVRERLGATWGLAETGAAGPSGNRYGDAAGHACFGISGSVERATTLETGSADRQANMRTFALEALEFLLETVENA